MDRRQTMSRRVVLTPKLAREIYEQKLKILTRKDSPGCLRRWSLLRGQSVSVATRYNVSAKTIRDIWNRKTWTFDTSCLWQYEDVERTDSIPCSQFESTNRWSKSDRSTQDLEAQHLSTMVCQASSATDFVDCPAIRMYSSNPYLCSPSTTVFKYIDESSIFQDPIHLHGDLHFLSVSEDPGFLSSTLSSSEVAAFPWSSVPLDPFHADWPHWDTANPIVHYPALL
jgi:hypothetical protein